MESITGIRSKRNILLVSANIVATENNIRNCFKKLGIVPDEQNLVIDAITNNVYSMVYRMNLETAYELLAVLKLKGY